MRLRILTKEVLASIPVLVQQGMDAEAIAPRHRAGPATFIGPHSTLALTMGGHVIELECPLSGVKRTCRFALHMSAFDPKRKRVASTWSFTTAQSGQ